MDAKWWQKLICPLARWAKMYKEFLSLLFLKSLIFHSYSTITGTCLVLLCSVHRKVCYIYIINNVVQEDQFQNDIMHIIKGIWKQDFKKPMLIHFSNLTEHYSPTIVCNKEAKPQALPPGRSSIYSVHHCGWKCQSNICLPISYFSWKYGILNFLNMLYQIQLGQCRRLIGSYASHYWRSGISSTGEKLRLFMSGA
jgi:hypothetical protein